MTISRNVSKVLSTLRTYESQYQREPGSVELLAVTKTRSAKEALEALNAGLLVFGENYLQEALDKMAVILHPDVEWHFIGCLQSNKTAEIAERFAWVHTVCNEKTARRLSEQRPEELAPLNICLEVNVSGEETKSGLREFAEVLELAKVCLSLPRLRLRGLMAIPAPKSSLEEQRAEFKKLVMMQDKLKAEGMELDTLSMGMTEDLEAAVAEGATIVRVGRGIFGDR